MDKTELIVTITSTTVSFVVRSYGSNGTRRAEMTVVSKIFFLLFTERRNKS